MILAPLWELLETAPDPVAVTEQWQTDLGDAFGVVQPFIRTNGQMALTYPHPTRYGEELAVEWLNDGTIIACDQAHDPSGVVVRLTRDDIAMRELVLDRLAVTVAKALGLR